MTCTSGILVDIFPKLEAAEWGKGNQNKGDFSVSSAHLTTVLIGGGGKFPTDVQR